MSEGGEPNQAGGTGNTGGGAGAPACDCDDGSECTLDVCVEGSCEHTARHFLCPLGQRCTAEGCAGGDACAKDEDCDQPDPCLSATCDPATARCVFAFLDGDRDGVAPESCAGADCNDADSTIHAGHAEACDGKDNDCDGVSDPPQESGCPAGKSCASAACVCDAPTSACNGSCFDLQSDNQHCGQCGEVCAETETCMQGECECNDGLERCGDSCVDLNSNVYNCGECGTNCGNALCEGGGCMCPGDTEDCSSDDVPVCKATQTDEQNCGACGETCLLAGLCQSGGCDSSLEWVKLYGTYNSERKWVHVAPMAADQEGNVFVAFSGEAGEYRAIPGGDTALWSSRSVIAKFDANGDMVWSKPTDGIGDVAVVGGDVWVMSFMIYTTPSVNIAGQQFSTHAQYQAATLLVRLDGTDGSVEEHFQLDHPEWNTNNGPYFVQDGDNLYVAGQTTDVVRDEYIWLRTSPNHYAYIYKVNGDLLWLPGTLAGATIGPNGKLVVATHLPGNVSVSFGGDTFTTNQYGAPATARFTQDFVHEVSYLNTVVGTLVPGMSPLTLAGGSGTELLRQVDDTGAVTKSVGSTMIPFYYSRSGASAGHIFMIGNSGTAQEYEGRSLPPSASLLLSFDATTLQLDRAVAFEDELFSAYGYGRIDDFAVVDGGSSVVLSVLFDGGVIVDNQRIEAGYNYKGLALFKFKLYP